VRFVRDTRLGLTASGRAVISTSFADISAATPQERLLPIIVDAKNQRFVEMLEEIPTAELSVDLSPRPCPADGAR